MSSITTTPFAIGECPACHTVMTGTLQLELQTDNFVLEENKTMVGMKATGFSITHNCVPRRTR